MTVETIEISPTLRVRIEHDRDSQAPDWDMLGKIAFCSDRETLGDERTSREGLRQIQLGIEDGSLIGMPVYAYVHSGVTIATTPFSCRWDSGQSGYVYTTKEKAIQEFGKKILTAHAKELTLKCLADEVKMFDQYLTGDVYGIIVERMKLNDDEELVVDEELESCWGYYGLDYAKEEAARQGAYWLSKEPADLLNEAVV